MITTLYEFNTRHGFPLYYIIAPKKFEVICALLLDYLIKHITARITRRNTFITVFISCIHPSLTYSYDIVLAALAANRVHIWWLTLGHFRPSDKPHQLRSQINQQGRRNIYIQCYQPVYIRPQQWRATKGWLSTPMDCRECTSIM